MLSEYEVWSAVRDIPFDIDMKVNEWRESVTETIVRKALAPRDALIRDLTQVLMNAVLASALHEPYLNDAKTVLKYAHTEWRPNARPL